MMASLDTSILVDVLRRRSRFHQHALEKLDELKARGEILATTRFTVAELYVGIELSDNPERDQSVMSMHCWPISKFSIFADFRLGCSPGFARNIDE